MPYSSCSCSSCSLECWLEIAELVNSLHDLEIVGGAELMIWPKIIAGSAHPVFELGPVTPDFALLTLDVLATSTALHFWCKHFLYSDGINSYNFHIHF